LIESYYAAGIDEYWLIDARNEEIRFDLFVRGGDAFVLAEADADGYRRSLVFDTSFRLARLATPAATADYRLLSR
jgi:Uma2 family endonuclease